VNSELSPHTSFSLPGGRRLGAHLHRARTVCRRAERRIVGLAAHSDIGPTPQLYLNRLSDVLFVMARAANDGGAADVLWVPGANR